MNRYLAFISYRHTGRDSAAAGALRRGLESFHAGKRSALPRVRKVFRDTDELPTSSDLGADIENALRESGWLIAVCSEDYTGSRWCLSEIRRFIAMGRKDRILPVLISGTPETAMPEEIRDLEPAADLRNSSRLKREAAGCVHLLLGRMSGEDPDELLNSQRRFRMARTAAGAAALAAAVFGFALYANHTADVIAGNNLKIGAATGEALAAREEAIRERNSALLNQAEYTAVTCRNLLAEDDTDGAIRTALGGLPEDLHGEEPVSNDLLGVLQTALSIRKPAYSRVSSTPLDFRVTDCDSLSTRSGLLTLSGEGITALNLNDGSLSAPGSDMGESIAGLVEKGLALGYRHVIGLNSGPAGYAVFYDPGKPVCTVSGAYTLNGEPFRADRVVHNGTEAYFLAWHGGEKPEAALFRADEPEAAALLQNEGEIVSAVYIDEKRIAAADSTGALAVYSSRDGAVLYTAETDCRFIQSCKDSSQYLFAITTEGGICCLEKDDGRTVWTVQPESPAVYLDCCRKRDGILAVCEDGARLYSMSGGTLKQAFPGTEGAVLAYWDNGTSGIRFVLVAEDRAERYEYDWNSDEDLWVSMALNHPEMPSGSFLCWSADGRYLYLERGGDIGKWDAGTGECLWVSPGGWGDYSSSLAKPRMSADGSAFWRQTKGGTGLEKISAENGEILFTAEQTAGKYFPMPDESPDRTKGLIVTNEYSHELVVIDAETGRKLWQTDLYETDRPAAYSAAFTEDSEQVWLRLMLRNPDGLTVTWVLRRYAAADGTLLREDRFGDREDPLYAQFDALTAGGAKTERIRFDFCGEAAWKAGAAVRRVEDNALLIDGEAICAGSGIGSSNIDLNIAPGGGSICLSGPAPYPPLLIHPQGADALAEKAKERTGGDTP